jgi:hypothetical protein
MKRAEYMELIGERTAETWVVKPERKHRLEDLNERRG